MKTEGDDLRVEDSTAGLSCKQVMECPVYLQDTFPDIYFEHRTRDCMHRVFQPWPALVSLMRKMLHEWNGSKKDPYAFAVVFQSSCTKFVSLISQEIVALASRTQNTSVQYLHCKLVTNTTRHLSGTDARMQRECSVNDLRLDMPVHYGHKICRTSLRCHCLVTDLEV